MENCRHEHLEIIELDESPLFCIYYCCKHDNYFDGYGKQITLPEKEVVEI